jgi:hypothetical protein
MSTGISNVFAENFMRVKTRQRCDVLSDPVFNTKVAARLSRNRTERGIHSAAATLFVFAMPNRESLRNEFRAPKSFPDADATTAWIFS